jgi:hypothetical protein
VIELPAVLALAPARVIEVLLAAGGVDAGGMQMAKGVGADSDVAPGGRDRQFLEP